jgi:hypothetical protein
MNQTVVLGLTTAVCTEKMKSEGKLINMYLRGQQLEGAKHTTLIGAYMNSLAEYARGSGTSFRTQWAKLSPIAQAIIAKGTYSGPIHSIRSFCQHRECDKEMFNNDGVSYFNKMVVMGLRKDPQAWSNVLVADMYNLTLSRCADTTDGRHYKERTMNRQLGLLTALLNGAV